MKVRILLNLKNSSVSNILPETSADSPSVDSEAFSLPNPTFTLSPADILQIPSYSSSRYSHPVMNIRITVPEDDAPVVASWFGGSTSNIQPSDTLIKRMTAAVIPALENYFIDMARMSWLCSPFKIGYALRLADGSHTAISTPVLLIPNEMAPTLAIREPAMSNGILSTITEVINSPMILRLSFPAIELPSDLSIQASHVDVFATKQTKLISGNESVTDVRTGTIFGERVPIWLYSRTQADIIRTNAQADTDYRTIAQIPISDALGGINNFVLPDNNFNLDNWNSLPKFTDQKQDNSTSEQPSPIGKKLLTIPLDLNMPEVEKRLRGVSLRGIFPRGRATIESPYSGITMHLYGSHHRNRWHKIATAAGPHIRLLRTVRFRWYMLEITAPSDALLEALTFDLAL